MHPKSNIKCIAGNNFKKIETKNMFIKKSIIVFVLLTVFVLCISSCALPKENCGKTAAKKHQKEMRKTYGRR